MFDLQFKISIIDVYNYYNLNNFYNYDFLKMINKCFNIKKTTFYNWLNDDEIINAERIYINNNKLINNVVETFIVNLYNSNNKIGIKNIKKQINNNFKISLRTKDISFVFYKNNIKSKNIKQFDFYKENKK